MSIVTNNIYNSCSTYQPLSLSLSLSLPPSPSPPSLSLSLQVQRRYNQGDYAGAQRASKLAYKWGSAAVMFGIAFMIIFVILKLYFEDRHIRRYYY